MSLIETCQSLEAFIAIMHGVGTDCVIPETVTDRLGIPIKLGDIMRDARKVIADYAARKRAKVRLAETETGYWFWNADELLYDFHSAKDFHSKADAIVNVKKVFEKLGIEMEIVE